jgi:ABC-2 type transport system permease protein
MRALWIALKDLRLLLLDKKAFLTLIVTPFVLVAILGFALSGFVDGDAKIEKFPLAVVNEDSGNQGKALIDSLKTFGGEHFDLIETDKADAEQQIKDKDIPVMLYLPPDFSSTRHATIERTPQAELEAQVTENFVTQIVNGLNTQNEVKAVLQEAASKAIPANAPTQKPVAAPIVEAKATSQTESLGADLTTISSFQYYSVGMGVMFMLLTGMNGLSSLIEERNNNTFQRILTASVNMPTFLIGKYLSIMVLCLLQFGVLILGTRLIFDVAWGDQIGALLLLLLAFVFATSGIVMLLASFVKNETMANIIRGIGVQVLALLGGSIVPIASFPDAMQYVAWIAPNYWAMEGFLNLMSGQGLASITAPLAVLCGIGLVTLSLGWVRLARV